MCTQATGQGQSIPRVKAKQACTAHVQFGGVKADWFCLVLCGRGYPSPQVRTETKTKDAAETTEVWFNYKDWVQQFKDLETCTYTGETHLFLSSVHNWQY